MKESLITKLPTNELMNPSQKKKRKHRQVLDKLVLFLKCNQIHCFLCQSIPGNPHLAPIRADVLLSHRAAGAGRALALPWLRLPRRGAWLQCHAAAGGPVLLSRRQPEPQLPDLQPAACVPIPVCPVLFWLQHLP